MQTPAAPLPAKFTNEGGIVATEAGQLNVQGDYNVR